MSALALQSATDTLRTGRATPQPLAVLAQRKSSLGGPGAITAPPITDAGRPLDAGVRSSMESGFGQDFSSIRVHDDARAHDSAREMGARAYAAGDHIVFGEGHYRPETAMGQALIAHELAHSVQQGGVQMKADGPLPAASDAELEGQADRAAAAVTAGRTAPALSRIGTPAVFRNGVGDPAVTGSAAPVAAGPQIKLPPGMIAKSDDPPGIGTTELVVEVTSFTLPVEKGMGAWVQKAYTEAGNGGRLVFSPLIEGGKVAAYKEGAEDYKSIWLANFGFSSTLALSQAFQKAAATDETVKTAMADKGVAKVVTGLASGLKAAGCDIDHIVEKQMGGTSIPSNLQILESTKNQNSGRQTYQALVDLVNAIRDPNMRGAGVKKLQLHIKTATVPAGTSDPSYIVEDILRKGLIKGSDTVKAAAEGKPVALAAGGVGETVRVKDKGKSIIEEAAKRIVPGMRLTGYERGPQGAASKADKVEGELDSRAIAKTGATDAQSFVKLVATLQPAGTPAVGAAAGGEAATENAAAAEQRKLTIPAGPQKIKFYYPYLSPGYLTSASLDDKGNLIGEGIIEASVRFLGNIKVRYGPDQLDLIAPIDTAAMNKSKMMAPLASMFRFTDGSLSIDLVRFKPEGKLGFSMGPSAKPVLLGEVSATAEGGAFVAKGSLKPAATIPGIKEAAGEVAFHSEKGWSGKLKAASSSIPNSTIDAEIGFTEEGGKLSFYGNGGITTKVKDSTLELKAGWAGGDMSYKGSVTVPKPLPLVESVILKGRYANSLLYLEGEADIKWKNIAAKMTVYYSRKDGEDGKFGGKADVDIKTEKAAGSLNLNFNEQGQYWGKGSISYQVTKDIRPTLGVELTKDQRVKVFGEVKIADIPLTKEWPKPGGGDIPIIKGIGVKFSIPTPVPAVTAYGEIRGGLSVGYGVGPVSIKGVTFNGELYPLEEDPKVKAQLKGKLSVPAYGEIRGTFGAYIGLEVALGAIGAKGGIEVKPTLGVKGEGAIEFDAAYEAGAFSFSAEAYAKGSMYAKLGVDLKAELYAAWGLFSHTWTYPVASVSKQLGPELKITLGKVAYGKNGEITWPSLSQIDVNPKEIDPKAMVMELLGEGKATEK